MKFIQFFLLLLLTASVGIAQPGMYSESDIEYQNLFMDALIAKQTGDTETQKEKLNEITRRDKTAHAAYYELARVFKTEGNLEMAQKNANKAVQLESDNQWYQLLLSEIYEEDEQFDKAINAYQKLLLIEDNNDLIYHKLAYNQLRADQPDKAVSTLEKLQDKVGINEETSRRIFDIHNKSGKKKKAVATLRALSDTYPDDVRLMNNLAGYLFDMGKEDEAREIFERVLKLDPSNSQASLAMVKKNVKRSEASNYLRSLQAVMENKEIPLDNKIQELMPYLANMAKEGETTAALKDISQTLINLYPEQAKAYAVRGDVLFYTGAFKEAEQAYSNAIKLDDRKYTLWEQWMTSLWELESPDKLYHASYDAIDLFPNQVHAMLYHIVALSLKNENDEANYFLNEAKLIAGKNELLKTKVAIVESWIQRSDLTKADINEKLKSFNLKGNTTPIFFEMVGDLYKQNSDKAKSKEFIQKAIELGANAIRLKKKLGA